MSCDRGGLVEHINVLCIEASGTPSSKMQPYTEE